MVKVLYSVQISYVSRFGGSQSSQSQATSKTCDMTETCESSSRAADSDSDEGEDPKYDLDPFASPDQTEATTSEIWYIV